MPIHVIGGIADASSGSEGRGFVRAVREHGVIGASLYNWSLTRESDWAELRHVPVNPTQSPALPLSLPWTEGVGYLPGGDRTHPAEVFFTAGPLPGPRTLTFEAFDVQPGEVQVLVNWQPVGTVAPGPSWSVPQSMTIPDEVLRDGKPNLVGFVSSSKHPDWTEWGTRSVSIG